MDTRTPEKRSEIMASVKGKNTGPEMEIRRLVFGLGYRYRIHYSKLPGKPDIAFPARRKVVFVHGCFWHGHGCAKGRLPKSKLLFWKPKIAANKTRDEKNIVEIRAKGWKSLVVWQCETKKEAVLTRRIARFLDAPNGARR
jgi:DNA mismatch endonuclease (patch repair protein)